MATKIKCCGLAALMCAAVYAPAFSATAEELSASQESSFAAVSMAGVSAAEKAVPASAKPSSAFFMNEEACAGLDRMFIMQPTKESAVNMFRPCVEAISKTSGVQLKVWGTSEGISIFHSERPEAKLPAKLTAALAKRRNQVFGYPVIVVSNASERGAKFMNQEACSALDRQFIMQPSKESAANMMRPCVAAIGKAYNVPMMLWQEKSFTIYISKEVEIPPYGRNLSEVMTYELAKRGKSIFGYPVVVMVGWPSK